MNSLVDLRTTLPARLQSVPPRSLQLASTGGIVLILAAMVFYLLLPEWRAARSANASLTLLQASVKDGADLDDKLLDLRGEVSVLERTLNGDASNLPIRQMEAFVIGRLQTISWRNNVILDRVQPRPGTSMNQFRELIFDVDLETEYFDFYEWLSDVGDELGFVVVKRFEMSPASRRGADNGPGLQVRMTMAAYRKRDP